MDRHMIFAEQTDSILGKRERHETAEELKEISNATKRYKCDSIEVDLELLKKCKERFGMTIVPVEFNLTDPSFVFNSLTEASGEHRVKIVYSDLW